MKNIQLLVLDVDGTMTDGGVYYDDHGNETKKFAIKDGAALVLAHAAGLQVMICTGRECPAVARRAAELKVEHLHQNVKNKKAFLADFMQQNGLCAANVAYCGDDLNDLAAMSLCGLPCRCLQRGSPARRLHLPAKGRRGCGARHGGKNFALLGALAAGRAKSLWGRCVIKLFVRNRIYG